MALRRKSRIAHTGVHKIGGNRLTQNEREPYMRKLRALPIVHAHWPHQCRCGGYGWVIYRRRKYCQRCGARFDNVLECGKDE